MIIFKFCPWFSLFLFVWGRGKKVTTIQRRSSSRGLGTPEVKIASAPVPLSLAKKWRQATYRYEKKNSRPIGQNPLQIPEFRT